MGETTLERRVRGGATTLRAISLRVALVLALLLGARAAVPVHAEGEADRIVYAVPDTVPLLRRSYGLGEPLHVVVTDDRVSPHRAVLERGQRVVWTSQAGHGLRIVFDAGVARSMLCDGLVHFSVKGSELRSGQLRPGEEARFCELAPGVYPYSVELDAPPSEDGAPPSRPQGVLVVRSGS